MDSHLQTLDLSRVQLCIDWMYKPRMQGVLRLLEPQGPALIASLQGHWRAAVTEGAAGAARGRHGRGSNSCRAQPAPEGHSQHPGSQADLVDEGTASQPSI